MSKTEIKIFPGKVKLKKIDQLCKKQGGRSRRSLVNQAVNELLERNE